MGEGSRVCGAGADRSPFQVHRGEASTDDSLIIFSYPDTLKGRMSQTASTH